MASSDERLEREAAEGFWVMEMKGTSAPESCWLLRLTLMLVKVAKCFESLTHYLRRFCAAGNLDVCSGFSPPFIFSTDGGDVKAN